MKDNIEEFHFIDLNNFDLDFQVSLNVQSPKHQLPCFLFLKARSYSLSHLDSKTKILELMFGQEEAILNM